MTSVHLVWKTFMPMVMALAKTYTTEFNKMIDIQQQIYLSYTYIIWGRKELQ